MNGRWRIRRYPRSNVSRYLILGIASSFAALAAGSLALRVFRALGGQG